MKRIIPCSSVWDSVSWDLVSEVISKVRNGFIPEADVPFVLVSRDLKSDYYEPFMARAKDNEVRVLSFPTFERQDKEWKLAIRAAKEDGNTYLINKWRTEHDREILRRFPELLAADLHVALGWMRIFSEEMCEKIKAINLHPALPWGPKGTFRDVIRQQVFDGDSNGGVMMHLLTKELDRGPAISYCRYNIVGPEYEALWQLWKGSFQDDPKKAFLEMTDEKCGANPLFSYVRLLGVIREAPLILRTIRAILEGRIRIENGQVLDAGGNVLNGGYDLTEEIEREITKGKG